MPAIIFDVHADQERDFNLNLRWFTKKGFLQDLSGWGAVAEVRVKSSGVLVARSTHADRIVLHTEEGSEGEIDVNFAAADMVSEDLDCEYEVVLHPVAADPTDRPEALIRGLLKFRPKVTSLSSPN